MSSSELKYAARDLLFRELRQGRAVELQVATDSMSPGIRPGDVVTVAPLSAKLRAGDIVVVDRDEDWIVHRFLGTFEGDGKTHIVTRGDNSRRSDAPLPVDAVAGKVTGIRRGDCEREVRRRAWHAFRAWLAWQRLRLGRIVRRIRETRRQA